MEMMRQNTLSVLLEAALKMENSFKQLQYVGICFAFGGFDEADLISHSAALSTTCNTTQTADCRPCRLCRPMQTVQTMQTEYFFPYRVVFVFTFDSHFSVLRA